MNSYDLFISELKVPDGMWMCQFLIWQVLLSSWQSVTTASTLSSKWWTYKAKAGILQKETVRAKAAQRTFEEWYYTYVKLRHLHPELAMLKCMFSLKLFQHPRVRSTSRSETGWSLQPLTLSWAVHPMEMPVHSCKLACNVTAGDLSPAAHAPAGGSHWQPGWAGPRSGPSRRGSATRRDWANPGVRSSVQKGPDTRASFPVTVSREVQELWDDQPEESEECSIAFIFRCRIESWYFRVPGSFTLLSSAFSTWSSLRPGDVGLSRWELCAGCSVIFSTKPSFVPRRALSLRTLKDGADAGLKWLGDAWLDHT